MAAVSRPRPALSQTLMPDSKTLYYLGLRYLGFVIHRKPRYLHLLSCNPKNTSSMLRHLNIPRKHVLTDAICAIGSVLLNSFQRQYQTMNIPMCTPKPFLRNPGPAKAVSSIAISLAVALRRWV